MGTKIKETLLIFSNLGANSYKSWRAELHDDGRVISYYSAVGGTEQSKDYGHVGERFFEKKIKEKERKGYSHAKVLSDTPNIQTGGVSKQSLADIAVSQIRHSNDAAKKLIRRLADANIHTITAATSITYNSSSGLFQTPLGIVLQEGIDEARNLLPYFLNAKSIDNQYEKNIDTYLKLIPRNKGHKLRYADVFPDKTAVQKESDLLDALENSLALVAKTPPTQKDAKPVEQVFKLRLDVLDDQYKRDRITEKFEKSKKRMHSYDNVKIREIYLIDIEDYNKDFREELGQIEHVYHGSSQSNILSLLKSGILISPPATAQIAGKMFGNGVYGSQTSSKSLGYTLGRWGQSKGDSGWLVLCDFAMGKPFYPTSYGGLSKIPSGYDSCWALPGKTGLQNDELIVYKTNQIKMKYLVEVK